MSVFEDSVVPTLLGAELARQRPAYVAGLAIQPTTVHDYAKGTGEVVELNRQQFNGNVGLTKTARSVLPSQRIGVPSSTPSLKSIVRLTLEEYIGPVNTDGQAAPLIITYRTMAYGRRNLWDFGMTRFHESIGSGTLSDDYQRWFDAAAMISELAKTTVTRNPGGVADGATTAVSKISSTDTLRITETLSRFNTPRFPDGFYHCLCDNRFLTHLQEDTNVAGDYRAVLTGMAFNGQQSSAIQMAGAQAALNTPSGVPLFLPPMPFIYNGVAYWATNMLEPRTVNALPARLAYYFGAGSVLMGSGGAAGQVQVRVHENTDYGRLYAYIWTAHMATINPIPPAGAADSGVVIEARTFAV